MVQNNNGMWVLVTLYVAFMSFSMYDETQHCHAVRCPAGYELTKCNDTYAFEFPSWSLGKRVSTCTVSETHYQNCYTSDGGTRSFFRRQVFSNGEYLHCVSTNDAKGRAPSFVQDSSPFLWGELGALLIPLCFIIVYIAYCALGPMF